MSELGELQEERNSLNDQVTEIRKEFEDLGIIQATLTIKLNSLISRRKELHDLFQREGKRLYNMNVRLTKALENKEARVLDSGEEQQ